MFLIHDIVCTLTQWDALNSAVSCMGIDGAQEKTILDVLLDASRSFHVFNYNDWLQFVFFHLSLNPSTRQPYVCPSVCLQCY